MVFINLIYENILYLLYIIPQVTGVAGVTASQNSDLEDRPSFRPPEEEPNISQSEAL
jgi:hypothetical protein